MNDNPIKTMLANAQQQDLNRQRQIEAQKMSINRLLEARESEGDDAELLAAFVTERSGLQTHILELQAKLDNVAKAMADTALSHEDRFDKVIEALAGRPA